MRSNVGRVPFTAHLTTVRQCAPKVKSKEKKKKNITAERNVYT